MRSTLLALLVGCALVVCWWTAHAAPLSAGQPRDSMGVEPKPEPRASAPRPALARAASPSGVVYPAYRSALPAAHRVHAEQAHLACDACHAAAATSQLSSDWLRPGPEPCVACHEHRFDGVPVAMVVTPRVRFSHARHAAEHIDCATCHGNVSGRDDAAGNERMPLMSTCLRCHGNDRGAPEPRLGNCRKCHVHAGGVMRTRFREGFLVPSSTLGSVRHATGWLWQHGEAAMIRESLCRACHQESECVNCHDGRLRPRRIHPSDWLSLHGIDARQQGAACNSCHRSQSECLTCHLRVGLSPSGPRADRATQGRFHPPASVWTDRPRTGRHHATQARLHMDECVSCHQERDCAVCHATAGVGGPGNGAPFGAALSPHPPSFRSTCGGLLGRNPRPCLTCHRPDDPKLILCR